ncbi:MAG TPA: patatin-like phospholipase family protein [Saprospiraceae bacterium]|nr:patatin-like phospholipase family protein [Saprospiraceae bacterium]MCB9268872.1 patatin-like phospholipase family protein [Lewinellaceae bacterium]HPG08261.1 patatin-like phospholipase family protein [Saprospiraceae bacterium]HRV86165.1 patatin-like phospholipase family protein [Saprospiraceae bacterium]
MKDQPLSNKSSSLRIGLALSGGGARGILHIGVFKALGELGIQPDFISGTSAGSIAGTLLAQGYSPKEMMAFIEETSLYSLFSLKMPSLGLTDLSNLRKKLIQYIPHNDIAALGIPTFVAVSNLNNGTVEYRREGPLDQIVAASCTIPLLFKPIHMDGSMYVDGGLLANAPVAPLHDLCDLIITVNLVPLVAIETKEMNGMINLLQRCFDLAALNNIKPQLRHSDIIIEPRELHEYSRFNLKKAKDLFDLGYQATMRVADEITTKIQWKLKQKVDESLVSKVRETT